METGVSRSRSSRLPDRLWRSSVSAFSSFWRLSLALRIWAMVQLLLSVSSRSSNKSSRLPSEVLTSFSSFWYSGISSPDSSRVVRMLLVVALRAVSVSLAEFSSGMSESDLPVSSSSAFSAASVLGSSVPRSLMSCLRT